MTDRIAANFQMAVAEAVPRARFFGVYEYRVAKASPLELRATDRSLGLPDMAEVDVRNPFGAKVTFVEGASVVVAFLNGDPSRTPFVFAGDPSAHVAAVDLAPGGLPATAHATTIEAVVNVLYQFMVALCAANAGPMTGAGVAASITPAMLSALAIAGSPAGTIAPFKTAIDGALAAKVADPNGTSPNLGAPNLRIA